MNWRRKVLVIAGVAAAMALMSTLAGTAWGQGAQTPQVKEVGREQIDAVIEVAVRNIVGEQRADGRWAMGDWAGKPPSEWDMGTTALAMLALQHSGNKRPETQQAIKQGLAYILQHPPSAKTYTAGLMEQVLYTADARAYASRIGVYGWMLCSGQRLTSPAPGGWGYFLPEPPGDWATQGPKAFAKPVGDRWSDNSNAQFAILGLVYAEKAGYQVPRAVWQRAREYYVDGQQRDGGWSYQSRSYPKPTSYEGGPPERSTMSMTLAGTVSIYLCDEALADKDHKQCETRAPNRSHEAGLKWIEGHWRPKEMTPYGWYACERLGMLMGYSEFGGHDWYQEGTQQLMADWSWMKEGSDNAFVVLFLSRGRTPVIINKLKREGDWNLHRYDISHLVEHLSSYYSVPAQWRIVTLDAKTEQLAKAPILWMSGHEALKFTAEEKAKLKEYVERGGTILAEDCCSKKPFDESFRAILKELWPEKELRELPKTHMIYTNFGKLANPPTLMGLTTGGEDGRLGVIYIPNGISCRWEVGGSGTKSALDAGANIYLYVNKMHREKQSQPRAPRRSSG